PLAESYGEFRARLGKRGPPVCVVVTARGELDFDRPLFRGGKAPVVVMTTPRGADEISKHNPPPGVRVVPAGRGDHLEISEILDALPGVIPGATVILVEGGPHLIGEFFDRGKLDELFLTLSPRLAGRDGKSRREGLVSGKAFLPDRLIAGTLTGVRRGGSHLFLRYAFNTH
ncbi:MAG TPA: dihydrofolate reductase family protein, partial [Bacteroidota bacterium]|nr:dihydrofolate reductase family protein [Bacteroidota bacterium]